MWFTNCYSMSVQCLLVSQSDSPPGHHIQCEGYTNQQVMSQQLHLCEYVCVTCYQLTVDVSTVAHLCGCKEWLFEFLLPSCQLKANWPFSSDLQHQQKSKPICPCVEILIALLLNQALTVITTFFGEAKFNFTSYIQP